MSGGHAQEPCLRAQARLDLELRRISAILFASARHRIPARRRNSAPLPPASCPVMTQPLRLADQFAATEDASCATHGNTGPSFVARTAISLDVIPVLVTGTHFTACSVGSPKGRRLGRDRSDPRRSKLDRPADIDILFAVTPGDPPLDLQRLRELELRPTAAQPAETDGELACPGVAKEARPAVGPDVVAHHLGGRAVDLDHDEAFIEDVKEIAKGTKGVGGRAGN